MLGVLVVPHEEILTFGKLTAANIFFKVSRLVNSASLNSQLIPHPKPTPYAPKRGAIACKLGSGIQPAGGTRRLGDKETWGEAIAQSPILVHIMLCILAVGSCMRTYFKPT